MGPELLGEQEDLFLQGSELPRGVQSCNVQHVPQPMSRFDLLIRYGRDRDSLEMFAQILGGRMRHWDPIASRSHLLKRDSPKAVRSAFDKCRCMRKPVIHHRVRFA